MNTAYTQTYGQLNNTGKRNVHLHSFLQKKGISGIRNLQHT